MKRSDFVLILLDDPNRIVNRLTKHLKICLVRCSTGAARLFAGLQLLHPCCPAAFTYGLYPKHASVQAEDRAFTRSSGVLAVVAAIDRQRGYWTARKNIAELVLGTV